MRLRVKFKKYHAMKYIGHLDMMRFFMKAVKRARIPIKYTEGFHPHPMISFALPLGVGVTSEGEYFDMELTEEINPKDIVSALNQQMADGVEIISARALKDDEKNAMASVFAAKYLVYYKKLPKDADKSDLLSQTEAFLSQSEIPIVKSSKKKERTIDVKPCIFSFQAHTFAELSDDFIKNDILSDEFCIAKDDIYYTMTITSGSQNNIKPQLVIEAYHGFLEITGESEQLAVHRFDLLGEKDQKAVSLGE